MCYERYPKRDTVTDDVHGLSYFPDLQLVRCPVCDLSTCDGTMQTLDASRHTELFHNQGSEDGRWDYNIIGSHKLQKDAGVAIFDLKYLKRIFILASSGIPQPQAVIASHKIARK